MRKEPIYHSTREAPAIMSLEQAAILMGITYDCAKSRAQRGELPGAFRSGKSWRVDKEALIESFGTRRASESASETAELTAAVRALLDALSKATA